MMLSPICAGIFAHQLHQLLDIRIVRMLGPHLAHTLHKPRTVLLVTVGRVSGYRREAYQHVRVRWHVGRGILLQVNHPVAFGMLRKA